MRLRTSEQTGATPAGTSGPSLREFAKDVLAFRDAFEGVRLHGATIRSGAASRAALVRSAGPLGVGTDPSATTLRSSEEVNTTPTSYGPTSPGFQGSSSSDPTVGGVYDGSNGDTTLTFRATNGGVVGLLSIGIQVRDDQDQLVDSFTIGFGDVDEVFTLSNGLEVSFGSGTISSGDSFSVDVSATVGSAVRPDGAFDGEGDAGAGFEAGHTVVDGAFEVNGVSIAVNASDTLNDVLQRITSSAAGVAATFDAATETVLLTQLELGPAYDVVVGSDTSGLLAALKLDTATSILGEEAERDQPIAQVAALSGIQSGTFSVNGVELTVDVLVDSLSDVLARIDASDAGATATFDQATGEVRVRGARGADLVLDDGTSGFFSGLDVEVGTFEGQRGRRRTRFRDAPALQRELQELARAYTGLLGGEYTGYGSGSVTSVRAQLEGAVTTAFDEVLGRKGGGTLRSGLGIDLRERSDGRRTLDVDAARLKQAFSGDGEELAEFLFADGEDGAPQGLLTGFEQKLTGVLNALRTMLGDDAVGLGLDVRA